MFDWRVFNAPTPSETGTAIIIVTTALLFAFESTGLNQPIRMGGLCCRMYDKICWQETDCRGQFAIPFVVCVIVVAELTPTAVELVAAAWIIAIWSKLHDHLYQNLGMRQAATNAAPPSVPAAKAGRKLRWLNLMLMLGSLFSCSSSLLLFNVMPVSIIFVCDLSTVRVSIYSVVFVPITVWLCKLNRYIDTKNSLFVLSALSQGRVAKWIWVIYLLCHHWKKYWSRMTWLTLLNASVWSPVEIVELRSFVVSSTLTHLLCEIRRSVRCSTGSPFNTNFFENWACAAIIVVACSAIRIEVNRA